MGLIYPLSLRYDPIKKLRRHISPRINTADNERRSSVARSATWLPVEAGSRVNARNRAITPGAVERVRIFRVCFRSDSGH